MNEVVLIVGAAGLFGGHLARRLLRERRFDVVCGGRDAFRLDAFVATHGGRSFAFDRANAADAARMLAALRPFAVVDAAGPFQNYGNDPCGFVRAVIEAGAHYLDIADAPDFVAEIGTLDALARAHGVAALSGVSSTPALSAAVADVLCRHFTHVEHIGTAILPGNRTPRGVSVMHAILSQVGKPMRVWRDGRWLATHGWADTLRLDLEVPGQPSIRRRLASLVDTPDGHLFPQRYRARSVSFRAGLELASLHDALRIMGWLRSRRLAPAPERLTALLHRAAGWLRSLGSDRGGMTVRVLGQTPDGSWQLARWDLIAPDGQGPKIPTLPVALMLDKLQRGIVQPGARACVGELALADFVTPFSDLDIVTSEVVTPALSVFECALGDDFARLPASLKELHTGFGRRDYEGVAQVDGPHGLLARIAGRMAGFPRSSCIDLPVRVRIDCQPGREVWTRSFGGHVFSSVLSIDAASGRAVETFWPLGFVLGLQLADGALHYPIVRARAFGWLPLPRLLLPKSTTREFEDGEGNFHFDVLITLPTGQRIVHYRGRLRRCSAGGLGESDGA